MATILTKRSNTASSVPVAGDLTNSTGGAELAVNTADKRLFTKDSGGTVVELGTNPSSITLASGTANAVPYLNGSKVLTSGSALTFDGTNLGLGVTPSAWVSRYKILQSGNQAALAADNTYNATSLGTNWYEGAGGDTYIGTGRALRYALQGNTGNHAWFTAPSGTAGNAISFTQAMTLDASGRLGIGRTSPSYLLDIENATQADMRLLATGNVDFLISSIASGLEARFTKTGGAGPITFYNGGSERARIDSSGDVIIGTTSAIGTARVTLLVASNRNGYSAQAGDDANYNYIGYNTAGSRSFSVYGNGNVVNLNNSYGAISDAKLKENVVDATPKLDSLMQVRVVNYNLIGDTQKQLGVIAQELEQVFPGMVDESPDRDEEGNDLGTTTKGVKYSVFVPMLVKAIQEQQTIINDLKARLDAANL